MFTSTLSVLALACTALAAPNVARAATSAPPSGFSISSVAALGTGCPPGTSYVLVSDDNTALTAVFSEFYAVAGPEVSISQNRKACQLTVSVKVPAGYNFGLKNIESAGYYQLDSGVSASQGSYYYFQGGLSQASAWTEFRGPVQGKEYIGKVDYDLTSSVRSPCGKDVVLNILNDVRVNNSKNKQGSGAIAKDLVNLKQTLNLDWQAC
ncbi:hypothetical protein DFP72DRAFT_908164 [Ephemerocybe angulata]|uniref:Secreted protein n=1 Tax=Ephemerocybe angulata TaxID=980116 RepID=A0A8H6M3X8_9AGAR|nr:hypothetical protein DFP72DRAFT_908164 [Tulosesus angulatus]